MTAEQLYHALGAQISDAVSSQMFGKPCYKIQGKAFIAFFQHALVCKLSGDTHTKALGLEGAKLFDPSAKGRPMKEWVQIPFDHQELWKEFTVLAHDYVKSML